MDNRAFKDQINLPCWWQSAMTRSWGVPALDRTATPAYFGLPPMSIGLPLDRKVR